MVVRMRHTKGHTGNRRSHHKIDDVTFTLCSNCGNPVLRHRLCGTCGSYRGRTLVDMKAKAEKKITKQQEKEAALKKEQGK